MFHFLFLGNVEKWNKEVDMKKSFMSFEPLGHTNKKVLFFSVNTKFFTFLKKNKSVLTCKSETMTAMTHVVWCEISKTHGHWSINKCANTHIRHQSLPLGDQCCPVKHRCEWKHYLVHKHPGLFQVRPGQVTHYSSVCVHLCVWPAPSSAHKCTLLTP